MTSNPQPPVVSLKYLKVTFDAHIHSWEVPAFRGAISKKVGQGSVLFHNHLPEGGHRHEYPLIQYKRMGKRPAILCFAEGVDQIHHYFSQTDWDIELGERHVSMRIDRLNLVNYNMKMLGGPKPYRVRDWVALNQHDYPRFQELEGLVQQAQFLESRLHRSLSYFAKGVGYPLDESLLDCLIDRITHRRVITVHGQKVSAFDIDFRANLSIPDYASIGKGASVGAGIVTRGILSRRRQ